MGRKLKKPFVILYTFSGETFSNGNDFVSSMIVDLNHPNYATTHSFAKYKKFIEEESFKGEATIMGPFETHEEAELFYKML
jgi:hypothetical protein